MKNLEFRKSEIIAKAERENRDVVLYLSYAERWEDTPAPQIENESYHFTKEEAIRASEEIDLETGFEAIVDKVHISYRELNNNTEFGECYTLEEVASNYYDRVNIHSGRFNNGGELPKEGVIVWYKHHRYMNYAYDILNIELVQKSTFKTYSELRNDSDSTSSEYAMVFDSIEELRLSFENETEIPFNKINSGRKLVNVFLEEHEVLKDRQ